MAELEVKTVAEIMCEELQKISSALDELRKLPLPEEIIIMYVQKKTRLAKRDIQAVFDALKDLNQKIVKQKEA